MSLLVINPGVCTTVQDLGRPGYREWGVPLGGAFDQSSYALANALLANEPGAAALELTLVGGVYEAQEPLAIALAGSPMEAAIESASSQRHPLSVPQTASLHQGDRLVFGSSTSGARTYLAVRGGWQTPLILGSRSSEERLRRNDLLPAAASNSPVRRPGETAVVQLGHEPIRVIEGPDSVREFDLAFWEEHAFRVGSKSDRMGLRLEGTAVATTSDPERLSTPVAPGAVQVAGGQLMILGVACGTMGGYPHVAQVISADLDRLGQARPGDVIRLRRVSVAEARRADHEARQVRAARLMQLATLAADWP